MTLHERVAALAADGYGPIGVAITFRDNEWSVAVSWTPKLPPETFPPSSAHGNGDTLDRAVEIALTDAERLVTVSGAET